MTEQKYIKLARGTLHSSLLTSEQQVPSAQALFPGLPLPHVPLPGMGVGGVGVRVGGVGVDGVGPVQCAEHVPHQPN